MNTIDSRNPSVSAACRRTRIALAAAGAWMILLSPPANAQGLPKLKTPAAVYELNDDGTGWRKVFTPGEFVRIGSLRIAENAGRLSFDGIKEGDPWNAARLLSCRLDGSDLQDHGSGAMPTSSPDGKRVAFCDYEGSVVKVLNLDEKSITPIERGWGVQWSPASNEIAYVVSGHVVIRDVVTGERRMLFPEGGSPYQRIQFNMAWSHDGRKIAIQGQRADGAKEIAVVDSQGAEFGYTVITPMKTISNFLAFHPSGGKVAFQAYLPGTKGSQLYMVATDKLNEPQLIAGQSADFDNVGMVWIDGGRKMRIISQQR